MSLPSYSETELERRIIDHLQQFLLELGTGFAFVGRQERFTFDEEHFMVDLVFYNRLLSGEDVQNPRAFLYRTADNFRCRALQSYQNAQSKTVPLENAEPYMAPFLPFSPEDMDYDRLAKALLETLSDDEI